MSEGTRERGIVKWFDIRRGFGFIRRQEGEDVFVHSSSLSGIFSKVLQEGDEVEFFVEESHKGLRAVHVVRLPRTEPGSDLLESTV